MNPREGASGIFMLYRRAQAYGHFVMNILSRLLGMVMVNMFAPGVGQKAAFFKISDEGRVVELVDIDLGDLRIDARNDFLNEFPCG